MLLTSIPSARGTCGREEWQTQGCSRRTAKKMKEPRVKIPTASIRPKHASRVAARQGPAYVRAFTMTQRPTTKMRASNELLNGLMT
jgi:hypothetical protein